MHVPFFEHSLGVLVPVWLQHHCEGQISIRGEKGKRLSSKLMWIILRIRFEVAVLDLGPEAGDFQCLGIRCDSESRTIDV